jgi:hypothetical protein
VVSARLLKLTGLSQAVKEPPSRLHAKVLSGLLAVKLKLAFVLVDTWAGLAVMVVLGGAVSTT